MTNPIHPHMLSTAEAAVLLKVRPASVRRFTAEGKLPAALKMPGSTGAYLYEPEAVEALRAERGAA